MSVVVCGHAKVAIDLIKELNADPFLLDKNKKSLLHLIIAKGAKLDRGEFRENQYPLFKVLLDRVIKEIVNAQDIYGVTPLHYACARQDEGYIEPLLDAGADITIKDINGNDCIAILRMEEQKRTNIIALAVSMKTLEFENYKLEDDYKKEQGQHHFFREYSDEDLYNLFAYAEPIDNKNKCRLANLEDLLRIGKKVLLNDIYS